MSLLSIRFLATAALALCATGLLAPLDSRAQPRSGRGFVRLEAIEDKAAPNDHPAQIGADLMRAALASVRVGGSMFKPGAAVFDDRELAELAPNVAATLGRAAPTQDVTFAVFGWHGSFGENSPATVTTGRLFVQGGRLNLILGHVQARYEDVGFGGTLELTPGQRSRPIGPVAPLRAEPARFADKRGDWILFDVAQLAALPRPAEPVSEGGLAPATRPAAATLPSKPDAGEARYQEIQSRLKVLDRLKAEGLITEAEYAERRRAILQSI